LAVRQSIGGTIGAYGAPLHENMGFKGQAIGFTSAGNVEVSQSGWGSYGNKLTVEVFVKVTAGSLGEDLTLIEDPGRFLLKLKTNGSILGSVQVTGGATAQVQSVPGVVPFGQDPANPGVGWRHLTLIYNGTLKVMDGKLATFYSAIELYGDSVLIGSLVPATYINGGAGNDTYYVDNISDVTTETSTLATEIDTVLSTVSRTLVANLEKR
jgi:hypothetical protein